MSHQKTQWLTVVLCLAAPLLVLGEVAPDESDRNRRQLEQWRKQPEHLQRLRLHAKAFLGLTDDQRQKILQLDRDLRKQTPTDQARLGKVMERYADWLDRLDDKDRQRVQSAPDKNARLAAVKELRDQEWMRYQPKALRDQYASLQGEARALFVTNLRALERQRRQDWQIAGRFWKELEKGATLPSRLADFPADVNTYVNEYLRPMLSKDEADRLDQAEGQWPLYPLTLVELADRHPPALPGDKGPKSFAELPAEVRNRFKFKTGAYPPKLVKAEKNWPGFAMALTAYTAAKKNFVLPHELWPWGYSCLSHPMQEFVDKKLTQAMDNDDKLRLIRAEGKWPEYPTAIKEIAKKHGMPVPWHTLPGLRQRWDRYRLARAE